MKRIMFVLTVAVLLAVFEGEALAQTAPLGTIDANNLDDDALGGASYDLDKEQALAQTFTAVNNGSITGAQVGLGTLLFNPDFDLGAYDITAEITSVDSSGAPANVLASTTIPGSAVTGTVFEPALVNITFENPAEVTAGKQYALTLTTDVPAGITGGRWLLETTNTWDSYSGGALFTHRPFSSPPDPWSEVPSDSIFAIYVTTNDTTPPEVTSTSPPNDATGVSPTANIRATFSEDMQSASVKNAFKLFKKGSTNQIAAQVSYDAATDKATLNPNDNLKRGVTYKAVVSTVAKDVAGNRLDQDDSRDGLQQKKWFFEIDN